MPSILAPVAPAVSTVSKASRGRASVGWLDHFPGRKSASDPQALAEGSCSHRSTVEAGGETWTVAAVLFYRDATSEWPVVKIERGADSAWLALEDGKIVRYDHLDLPVGPDGRASWSGRTLRAGGDGQRPPSPAWWARWTWRWATPCPTRCSARMPTRADGSRSKRGRAASSTCRSDASGPWIASSAGNP